MFEIAQLFYSIAMFKKAPQDVPASKTLLRFVVFVYAAISFLMLSMTTEAFNAGIQVVVELLLVHAFCKSMLSWVRKPERYQQTFTTLVGVDTLINFCALPALAALYTPQGEALGLLTMAGLMIWHWLVTGHILRHALSKSFPVGLGIALLYVTLVYQIMGWLFTTLNGS